MKITNKTVLLTGATGGIGSEIARGLAAAGARLVLVGRNEVRLAKLAGELGEGHFTVVADLSQAEDRSRLAGFVRQLENGVDILVNNAGVSSFNDFVSMSEAELEYLIQVNLTAPMLLTRSLLPVLENREEAFIVNIGSTFGSIGYPGFTTYSASKFGLRGFTEALRRELENTGIKVGYLAPRATKTEINSHAVVEMNNELGNNMDEPEVVVNALLSLLQGGKSDDCYLGWPEKLFVKLNSVFPRVVDSSLKKQLPVIQRYANES